MAAAGRAKRMAGQVNPATSRTFFLSSNTRQALSMKMLLHFLGYQNNPAIPLVPLLLSIHPSLFHQSLPQYALVIPEYLVQSVCKGSTVVHFQVT